MQWKKWLLGAMLCVTLTCMAATPLAVQRKESELPGNLSNPLAFANGKSVKSAEQLPRRRAHPFHPITKHNSSRKKN